MNRNIAYFISSNNKDDIGFIEAKNHFISLAQKNNFNISDISNSKLNILIIHEGGMTSSNNNIVELPIGNFNNRSLNLDRFLKLEIHNDKVVIVNDYVGSIPAYFSIRNYLSISNIEPCVLLDSHTTADDISYQNLYGFMRFMHFIWDETAYNHVFSMLPDAKYQFDFLNLTFKEEYLNSISSLQNLEKLDEKSVASKLNELNDELIYDSLSSYDQIILPLSSGYDSRMILASCSKNKDLKDKLCCFTYGSVGSIEVEAARRLTKKAGVSWKFIDLPCKFLEMEYLKDIHNIFGSTLHMHGMYQLEFLEEIFKNIDRKENICLTSGFMTGVPAGQHLSLLNIDKDTVSLTNAMQKFSQSQYWTEEELLKIDVFNDYKFVQKAEDRFQQAFNRYDGSYYQKSIMFDLWTRQRNFISYYPRTLEWKIPVVSPHMNKRYAGFLMSLPENYLNNRHAVELMFKHYYPDLASIVSNSNGIKSINNRFETSIFFMSNIIKKFKLSKILPDRFANKDFDFDLAALRCSGKVGIYPFFTKNSDTNKILELILPESQAVILYKQAINGSVEAYQRFISLQSLGMSFTLIR